MPIQKTRYKQQNIGKWLQYQKIKIENNSTDRYIQLSQNEYVKESLDKYLDYKKTIKNKIKLSWDEWKELLFEYCDTHKKIPTQIIK